MRRSALAPLLLACLSQARCDGALPHAALANEANQREPATCRERAPETTAERERVSSLVLALLPDTQYYSEGAPYLYAAQTRWLAARAEQLGEPFVMHLGDLVQTAKVDVEWSVADDAMRTLERAGVGYSIAPGNHDLRDGGDDAERDHAAEPYLRRFPRARAARQPSFRARDPLGYSEYHVVERHGVTLLIMALDWRPSPTTRAWARAVLAAHPRLPTIITTHELVVPTGDGGAVRSGHADTLWDELIRDNDQVFLAVGGHFSGSGYRVERNDAGHPVIMMVVDYQGRYGGGNGYLRLMELDFFDGEIEQLSLSPFILERFGTRDASAGETTRTPYDHAELTGPADKFTIPFDLVGRFTELGAPPPMDMTDRPGRSWLDAARDELARVPPPPSLDDWEEPAAPDDYPMVAGTLAHWRFDGFPTDASVAPGEQVLDLSGNGNTLTREDTFALARPEHLRWSDAHHRLSAAPGSVCSHSPSRLFGGFLSTTPDAPLNRETFPRGYTVEAFAQLSANWSAVSHGGSGLLARRGEAQDVGRGDPAPLAALGFSPTREIQWSSYPLNLEERVSGWSSPNEPERWYHLAVVNDGHSTRLYIDGYPARRDPVHVDAAGISSAGAPWTVGASSHNHEPRIFGGCVGELRVVGYALPPDEFLISRPTR